MLFNVSQWFHDTANNISDVEVHFALIIKANILSSQTRGTSHLHIFKMNDNLTTWADTINGNGSVIEA